MARLGLGEDEFVGKLRDTFEAHRRIPPSDATLHSYLLGRRPIRKRGATDRRCRFVSDLEDLFPGAAEPFEYRFWALLWEPLGLKAAGFHSENARFFLLRSEDNKAKHSVVHSDLWLARASLFLSGPAVGTLFFERVDQGRAVRRTWREMQLEVQLILEGSVTDAFADLLALAIESRFLERSSRNAAAVAALRRHLPSVLALPGFRGVESEVEARVFDRAVLSRPTVVFISEAIDSVRPDRSCWEIPAGGMNELALRSLLNRIHTDQPDLFELQPLGGFKLNATERVFAWAGTAVVNMN